MHPVHFHVGMYVAIAALLITAMKSSEGVVAAVYPGGFQPGHIIENTDMREAEVHTGHPSLNSLRVVSNTGE